MIPLVEEPKEHFQEFRLYEKCFFKCGSNAKHWHWRTNQPVCLDCAKKHKVSELPKCTPGYRVPTKAEYLKAI